MKNRWLNGALPAVCVHISIGSVYAWSVLTKHIAVHLGKPVSMVTWAFSIAIFFLGMSAAFMGNTVDKLGAKKSALLCALFYGVGIIGSGFAIMAKSLPLLLFLYGVVGGIGLGIGYITPIKTLIRWFYNAKGVASGIAVMGFGFAAMIAGPVMESLISRVGLANMFFIMGICYVILILSAALLFSPPPEGYEKPDTSTNNGEVLRQFSTSEATRTIPFYGLWFMLFVNITSGISLISIASPMLQDKFPTISPVVAASVVGAMSLTNGLGRFVWASLSDWLGRPAVFSGFLLLQVGLFFALSLTDNYTVFTLLLVIITSCYGAGFACIPAYLSDIFSTKNVSAIHGRILTAWAIAGIVGPVITTQTKETTGSYSGVLVVLSVALAIAFCVSVIPAKNYIQRYGKLFINFNKTKS